MVPPSTTLKPAGTPSLAEWASTFQCAVPRICQMPFRSGLRSGVRGPLYPAAVGTVGARGGLAPRCACAKLAACRAEAPPCEWSEGGAMPIVSTSRPVAPPMARIGFFIPTRESLPHASALKERPSTALGDDEQ